MKTTLQSILIAVCLCLTCTVSQAQLPDGSTAPDFTLTDLDGNTHNLQSILDQGKTVVLDFSATWCGPCWSYHNTHALADLYTDYGPSGTDEFFVMFIEGDTDTELACLYDDTGCSGGTQGNWVDGTPYPIVNVTTESVVGDYAIGFWPTIYTICPDGFIYESGQAPTSEHYSWKQSCIFDANLVSTSGMQCYEDQSGTADVEVTGGSGTITYSWSNGQQGQDLVNAFPGTYTCIATEGNGVERMITDVVVDGPNSELMATLNAFTDVTCHGANDGTIDVMTDGGTPGYSYVWNNGAASEDIAGLGGGSYSLVVTDDNGCTKDIAVDIVDPDAVEATVETTVENCGQRDATITATGAGGTGILTYTYGPSTNLTGVFTNVEAGDYNVIVTDENNCQFTEAITVDEIPNPSVEVFPVDALDCATTSVTLSAAADVGSDFSYVWTTPNGHIVSGEYSLTPVVDAPGDYKIVVVNTTNGCFSEATVTVDGSSDLPSIDIADPSSFSCSTTEVTIDATNSSSGSDYSFEWSTEDGVIVSGDASDMLIVSAAGTYTLVLTNTVSGCSTTSSVEVLDDPDVPTAAVASPTAIDCDNHTITLDGSGSSQGDGYEYHWSTADGAIVSAVDDEAIVESAGTYVLLVVNTNTGCSSEYEVIVDDEGEEVDALWVYQTNNLEVNLENLTMGNPDEMSWDMGNGEVVDGSIDGYIYDEAGVYEVCLTAENGCGADKYCLRVVVSDRVNETYDGDIIGIGTDNGGKPGPSFNSDSKSNSIANLFDVTVFPNPTNGNFMVNLTEERMVNNYQLIDMDGRTMLTQKVNTEMSQIEFNATSISNGTYFIQIQLDNEVITRPVVIMK